MKCLVLGVLFDRPNRGPLSPGPDGLEPELVSEAGLTAAYLPTEELSAAVTVELVLTFAGHVDRLHQAETVLPARYGCILDNPAAVADMLRRRHQDFRAALDRVDGCSEFTVRLMPAPPGVGLADAAPDQRSSPSRPGTAYLARRRQEMVRADDHRRQADAAVRHVSSGLSGLARGWDASAAVISPVVSGGPGAAGTLPAVHFLVERGRVEAFREAFVRVERDSPVPLLLTGPWPPAHFADGRFAVVP